MLRSLGLFIGLGVIWLLANWRDGNADDLLLVVGVAAAGVCVALRFGGVSGAFVHAAEALPTLMVGIAGALSGALSTTRAALAGDLRLKPGLMRLRTLPSTRRARWADLVSSRPGQVVIETDAEGLLVHALAEDEVDERLFARAAQTFKFEQSQ